MEWTSKNAVDFLKERMGFEEDAVFPREIGPFTREEMSWWLQSAETGIHPNGDKITH